MRPPSESAHGRRLVVRLPVPVLQVREAPQPKAHAMSKAKSSGVLTCYVCGEKRSPAGGMCGWCCASYDRDRRRDSSIYAALNWAARRARAFERKRNRATRFEAVRAREVATALKELNPKKARRRG